MQVDYRCPRPKTLVYAMINPSDVLFTIWEFTQEQKGASFVPWVVSLSSSVYVVQAWIRLPTPLPKEGFRRTPLLRWRRRRRHFRILGGITLFANCVVVGLYVDVSVHVQGKATAFPSHSHLAVIWGVCLLVLIVALVLLVLFAVKENNLKAGPDKCS